VGSIGTLSFIPNPLQAMLGDMLVWTNNDIRIHHIFLEDGTDVGQILPGESSVPVSLAAESTSYYCALHPSMVGTINRDLPVEPDDDADDDPYDYYRARRHSR
jgi:plastocyanin